MKKDKYFYIQLIFTLLVCAFLIVPVIMSVMAGLTNNYFVGVKSGFTFRWVEQVWSLYSDTIWLTLQIAIATTLINVVIGVPCAYVLAKSKSRWASIFDEILTLPIAIPGMAISLGLILAYGVLMIFVLVGCSFCWACNLYAGFMVKSVLSILQSINFRVLEEGAASLGASFWQRFLT